jgi:hypothetical protein
MDDSPGSKLSNYLPLVALVITALWVAADWLKRLHHPPVGTYIAIFAFVGAIVTIWPPQSRWAKAAWVLVFGAFLVLEITTLYQQRGEDSYSELAKTVAEDNRFAGLLKAEHKSFGKVLKQNQEQFVATMRESRGGAGYVWFLALARQQGEVPMMMVNDAKIPVRGVDLEIVEIPPKGTPNRLNITAFNMMNPRQVHIGDVKPGFQEAPFKLSPGRYDIRIITRMGIFDEHLEAVRDSSSPDGWNETYCVTRNNSSTVLKGTCPTDNY